MAEIGRKKTRRRSVNFGACLWDIRLSSYEEELKAFRKMDSIDPLQLGGLENLLDSLGIFLSCCTPEVSLSEDESFVRIYKSVTLETMEIVRADSSFNKNSWFSDIAVMMDVEEAKNYKSNEGMCFGKVNN
ncbi:MAG TPA: hypothetical protein VKB83_03120 [Nitrosopumilaceae archaeon]|nr:hypothetical protein [Nitrosopumilaceae archaeon]